MNDWNLTTIIEDNENIGTETSRFVWQELTQKDTVYLSASYSNKYLSLNFNAALIIPESFHVILKFWFWVHWLY